MLYENCLEKLWEETKRHPGIDLVQGDSYSEGMENKTVICKDIRKDGYVSTSCFWIRK